MCVWHNQSAANTSFPFSSTLFCWWMNGKAFTILNSRSFVEIFSLFIAYRERNFLGGGGNKKPQKIKKKTKVTFSAALVMAFLVAEYENRQLDDLPQANLAV